MPILNLLQIVILLIKLANEVSKLQKALAPEVQAQLTTAQDLIEDAYRQAVESPGA